nr:glycosyl hydrolase [uncultured Pedobacter sp.]
MKRNFKHQFFIACLLFVTGFSACKKDDKITPIEPPVVIDPPKEDPVPTLATVKTWLVDKNATDETAAMFYNMQILAKTKIMFGHQDDTKQGKSPGFMLGMSDIKEVTGAFPAVYGWDLLDIASFQRNGWFDEQANIIRTQTVNAYKRGGINTYCWHYWNPVASKSPGQDPSKSEGKNAPFYYKDEPTPAVSQILPGGSSNAVFKMSLDRVADYIKSIKSDDGKLVPVIFRPFHEMDGDWFWWGKTHCTTQQYKELYQYTVEYLRDEKQVHNVLFAWSPDRGLASNEQQYLTYYPGDDYVDVLGMDQYEDLKTATGITSASNKLKIMSDYAAKANKIAALTETGLADITQSDWYTQVLFKALTKQKVNISYAMVWYNGSNYYTPYKGHPAEADFIKFKNTSNIVFGDKVPDFYTLAKK